LASRIQKARRLLQALSNLQKALHAPISDHVVAVAWSKLVLCHSLELGLVDSRKSRRLRGNKEVSHAEEVHCATDRSGAE
jgi:hypothetical protein